MHPGCLVEDNGGIFVQDSDCLLVCEAFSVALCRIQILKRDHILLNGNLTYNLLLPFEELSSSALLACSLALMSRAEVPQGPGWHRALPLRLLVGCCSCA